MGSTHAEFNLPCVELLKPIRGAILFSWCVFQSRITAQFFFANTHSNNDGDNDGGFTFAMSDVKTLYFYRLNIIHN